MKFLKAFILPALLVAFLAVSAQRNVYDIILFGNKIGQTIVERKEVGSKVQFTLTSKSEANVFFSKKTSEMNYSIVYENGKLLSSYVKNVKDGVTEISNVVWQGTQYMIKKGAEVLHLNQPINFSSIHLYFVEPLGRTSIFSERLGEFTRFTKTSDGVYECKLPNGVNNIYRYKNGKLYELEMSKGASVYLRLAQ